VPQELKDPANVKTHLFRKMQHATEDLVHHIANYATATAALNSWCAERLYPHDSRITASILVDESVPVDTYKGILAIQASELLRYRSVVLKWGHTAVSEAENWYLPDRLPPFMRWQMRHGDQPFGQIIHPLQPRRTTIQRYSNDDLELRTGRDQEWINAPKPFQSFRPFKISSCTSEQS
jgi:hypothetical protein